MHVRESTEKLSKLLLHGPEAQMRVWHIKFNRAAKAIIHLHITQVHAVVWLSNKQFNTEFSPTVFRHYMLKCMLFTK